MPAFRIYFLCGHSFVSAIEIEADTPWDARDIVMREIASYPWIEKLCPDRIEIWQRAELRLSIEIQLQPEANTRSLPALSSGFRESAWVYCWC